MKHKTDLTFVNGGITIENQITEKRNSKTIPSSITSSSKHCDRTWEAIQWGCLTETG